MQLVHTQLSSCGIGASGTVTGSHSEQHAQVAQALSTLDADCDSHARHRSGQVNKLTIKSTTRMGDFITNKNSP